MTTALLLLGPVARGPRPARVAPQITDFLTDTLGVSLYASTAAFAVVLAAVFAVWYRQEHTLSITSINTARREAFYWAAILTTFALGTGRALR